MASRSPTLKEIETLAKALHAMYRADAEPAVRPWKGQGKESQDSYRKCAARLLENPPLVLRDAVMRLEGAHAK